MCKSKTVQQISVPIESSAEPATSDWVNTVNPDTKLVKCRMTLNKETVPFLIDSGASVNVLPKRYAAHLIPGNTSLVSFGGHSLTSLGNTRDIPYNAKNCKRHDVEFDLQPILGLHTAQKRHLLTLQD